MLAGSLLFYTHLVWAMNLLEFLGPNAWIPGDLARELHRGGYAWSYLWYIDSPALLWTVHVLALIVLAMFTVGLFTRVTSVLAFLITVSYCHRLTGAFFGLDQVNAMLAMYLMLGPCGAVYSLDRWLAVRTGKATPVPQVTVSANIAIRLIQLHMCIIYLFGGISKMRGQMWWDGTATWFAIVNSEYQSLDITWLVDYPWFLAALTHITVVWETYYCVLVWPKATRTITLLMAVCVHSGLAMFLGMITFGLAMLIGNLAFVSPALVRGVASRAALRRESGSRE
jgi:uncharacterized membrane protein YphA (DoxX/SURF4 family)